MRGASSTGIPHLSIDKMGRNKQTKRRQECVCVRVILADVVMNNSGGRTEYEIVVAKEWWRWWW